MNPWSAIARYFRILVGMVTPLLSWGTSSSAPAEDMHAMHDSVSHSSETAMQRILRAVLTSAGIPKCPSEIDPELPVIDSLEVVSTSRKDAVLAWQKPAVMPPGWIVEVSRFTADPKTRILFKVWLRHGDWEMTKVAGERLAVRVKSLQPASVYEMRVLAINHEGKVSEPGAFALVQTKLPWRIPSAVWSTLIGVVLGFAAYRLNRMRETN